MLQYSYTKEPSTVTVNALVFIGGLLQTQKAHLRVKHTFNGSGLRGSGLIRGATAHTPSQN